jgi:hypothetical protein
MGYDRRKVRKVPQLWADPPRDPPTDGSECQ